MPKPSTVLVSMMCAVLLGLAPGAGAQRPDPNAPYRDAYDVRFGRVLVGQWQGNISASKLSQRDGKLAGKGFFPRRGYEGRNTFGLVLHDHRHRNGLEFSEVHIGNIPCGPSRARSAAIHGVEAQGAAGRYVTVFFDNRLASTQRADFTVNHIYGSLKASPATVETRWTPDTFRLRLSGPFVAGVTPIRNGTFDHERQRESWVDTLHLNLEFVLERTPETQAQYDATLCEETELDRMRVVDTKPESGRQNVLPSAAFFVELDAEIHADSLNSSTVMLSTRDASGGYIFVPLELSLETPERLRIQPLEPLLPAVIYDLEIVSGEEGLRGRDSEVLQEDFRMSLSTAVNPDTLELDIHQVARNATLVHGKPAAARLFFEWEEDEDIHPLWQVLTADVEVEILDEEEKPIFPKTTGKVTRPDQLTKEDRRLGKHSLDVFGWTPGAAREPRGAVALVRPEEPYPEDTEPEPHIAEQSLAYAERHASRMSFDYFIAEHSEWAENGPDDQTVGLIARAAQKDREFSNQWLPVARVTGHYRGRYSLKDTVCQVPGLEWVVCEEGFAFWDSPTNLSRQGDFSALLQLFHEHIAARSSADIMVSYHPPASGGGGQTKGSFKQPESLRRPADEPYWFGDPDPSMHDMLHADATGQNMIVMSTARLGRKGATRPGVLDAPLVAHEFGHVFGLPHTPYANDASHRQSICGSGYETVAQGIDGMRIDLGGSHGWQKSSKDGNAQTHKPLLNLMFPCIWEPHADYWIDGNQYEWLVERLPGMLQQTRARGRASVSPSAPEHARYAWLLDTLLNNTIGRRAHADTSDTQWLLVSGLVSAEHAALLPSVTVNAPRPSIGGQGHLQVRIEDAGGKLLAQTDVGPEKSSPGRLHAFSATLPVRGQPARISLMREGKLLAELRAKPGLKAPTMLSHAPGAVFRAGDTLVWKGDGNMGLTYSVRFSPDGQAWSTLGTFLADAQFTPDPAALAPGPAAAFEISVHDGVTQQSTSLPVKVDAPLAPLATWPGKSEFPDTEDAAGAVFNTVIDASTLDAVTLLANGKAVAHEARLDPSGMVLRVAPTAPSPETDYVAIIDSGLQAQDGRRLANELRLRFAVKTAARETQLTAWNPARHEVMAKTPRPDTTGHSPDQTDEAATPTDVPTGKGEITLQVGQAVTLPMQVLRCQTHDDGNIRVDIRFDAPSGGALEMTLTRAADGHMTARASHGPQGQGDDPDKWDMTMADGQVQAQGHLGSGAQASGFSFKGACPASD